MGCSSETSIKVGRNRTTEKPEFYKSPENAAKRAYKWLVLRLYGLNLDIQKGEQLALIRRCMSAEQSPLPPPLLLLSHKLTNFAKLRL